MVSSDGIDAWTPRRRGSLDASERFAFAAHAIAAQTRRLLERRPSKPLPASLFRSLPRPSGALARHSDAIASAVLPEWLTCHCARTFTWATLLAVRDGLTYDAELLYAAAMLHDLGLCADPARDEPCFAVRGAISADQRLRGVGVDAVTSSRVASAIELHLDIRVALTEGVEAHLLNRGAALDVVGREAGVLERALRDEVVARWPRHDCKRRLQRAMRAEAKKAPKSRIALLVHLGFAKLIERAPFDA